MPSEEKRSTSAIASLVEIAAAAAIIWLALKPGNARPKTEDSNMGAPEAEQKQEQPSVETSTSELDNYPRPGRASSGKWRVYFAKPKNVVAVVTVVILLLSLNFNAFQAMLFRDQEQRQLRAYVGMHRWEAANPDDQERVIRILCMECDFLPGPLTIPREEWVHRDYTEFLVKNFGATPALHPRICMKAGASPLNSDGISSDEWAVVSKGCPQAIKFMPTLLPTEERPFRNTVTDERWIQIIWQARNHKVAVYFYGFIEYQDDFKNPHRTYICYRYVPPPNEGVKACGNVPYDDY